jgi:hypothetical protein
MFNSELDSVSDDPIVHDAGEAIDFNFRVMQYLDRYYILDDPIAEEMYRILWDATQLLTNQEYD